MADFDPTSLGAVAVEDAPFDPSSLGAVPVEQFSPESLGAVAVEEAPKEPLPAEAQSTAKEPESPKGFDLSGQIPPAALDELEKYGQQLKPTTQPVSKGVVDTVADNLDAAKSLTNEVYSGVLGMREPQLHLPRPEGKTVGAGIVRGLEGLAEGLTSKENIALMATIGGAPSAIQKITSGAFAAMMASEIPAQLKAVKEATDPGQTAEAVTGLFATTLMTALAATHAAGRPSGFEPSRSSGASQPAIDQVFIDRAAKADLRNDPAFKESFQDAFNQLPTDGRAIVTRAIEKEAQGQPLDTLESGLLETIKRDTASRIQDTQKAPIVTDAERIAPEVEQTARQLAETGSPLTAETILKNHEQSIQESSSGPQRNASASPEPVDALLREAGRTEARYETAADGGSGEAVPVEQRVREPGEVTDPAVALKQLYEEGLTRTPEPPAAAPDVQPDSGGATGANEASQSRPSYALSEDHYATAQRVAERIAGGVERVGFDEAFKAALSESEKALAKGVEPSQKILALAARDAQMKAVQRSGTSLDAPLNESGATLADSLISEDVSPYVAAETSDQISQLNRAADKLTPQERLVVREMGIEGRTAAEAAEIYADQFGDISGERVRQIYNAAQEKIKHGITEENASVKAIAPEKPWNEATNIPKEAVESPVPTQGLTSLSTKPSSKSLGVAPPGLAQVFQMATSIKAAAKTALSAVKDIPAFHDYRRSILNWSARNQASTGELLKASKDIKNIIPDETRREAITNWIQAGGDDALLRSRAAASTLLKRKKGYEAALTLTPEEKAVAQKVSATYDDLLQRAKSYGIEISEIQNYVNQIWRKQPLKEFAASSNRKLSESVRFAKQRFYNSFFDGEQAGLKPETKDIAKLLPIYMNEVNNAIAAKQLVADFAKGTASDGRPLVAPSGGASVIEDAGAKSYLILPEMKSAETADYVRVEQPALHDWRWRAADGEGNPILVKGDLLVHPEVASRLKNVLGQSAIREWYRSPSENPLADIPKAATKFLLDDLQSVAKATMLGFLSPFHQVQEGTHAIGHRVNPFGGIPKIDLTDAAQLDAARHGLMLLPDRVSANQFREGLDGSSRNLVGNLIGKLGKPGETVKGWSDAYQDYLFHQYIPGLKFKTYEHIVPRNMERYADDLQAGRVTEDQVKYLSAQQANAAYGHLNYVDMARNPTVQHFLQIGLLAPDFLEARGRFTGQAAKGAFSKIGREQLSAIATLAVTQYVAARILNQTLDGNPHNDHPFDVIVGNRKYTMRSVPEDIYKMLADPRKFTYGRLSPLIGRGAIEGLSGVNYRGEPTDFTETMKNLLAGSVPLTLQPATRGLSETTKDNPVSPLEQLIGSMGLHVSRYSPVSEIYQLSKDWIEKEGYNYGIDQRRAVYPRSKYQQLRYALEDGDFDKARDQIGKLTVSEKTNSRDLEKRFRESVNSNFTKNDATDEIFKDSLNEHGKQVYDAAIKRRKLLIDRYKHAVAGKN